MRKTVEARLLHIKKHPISLLFWFLLPVIGTITLLSVAGTVQDDSKVPVGIVVEKHDQFAKELVHEISSASFIKANELSKDEALYQLEKHELDSVFIIDQDFSKQVHKGNRNSIITSYRTNQSLAYTPVKEMILSYVQQETGRSKTANIVDELSEQYQSDSNWTFEEIIARSKEIQHEENLLQTSFYFGTFGGKPVKEVPFWSVWGIWGIFSMLATLLIFDWVVKEKQSPVLPRFAFMGISYKNYLVKSLIFYSALLIVLDLITMVIFHLFYQVQLSLSFIAGMFSYRLILVMGAFLLASFVKRLFRYYVFSFTITLVSIVVSGAILPINGLIAKLPWFRFINPLDPLLSGDIINFWPWFLLITFIIWLARKEQYYA
ncbi:ABC transporter permease [Virgibacillus phasianinus]|uniref:ABC transporter permease n=1 Tax=Virgibacillus phasianinus TaxID=2017483 RepID=UPI0012FD6102|nr:ABC transporter permease [Virgibacillus phasianinus]